MSPQNVWGVEDTAHRAEIIGGPDDGRMTKPIPFTANRDVITIDGLQYTLRVMRMPATEDRPERTTLVALHPGWPAYPLV